MLELVNDGEDLDGFLNGDDLITPAVIDASRPRLQVIANTAGSTRSLSTMPPSKKPVLFTPGVNHTTVAEHAFGLMIGSPNISNHTLLPLALANGSASPVAN